MRFALTALTTLAVFQGALQPTVATAQRGVVADSTLPDRFVGACPGRQLELRLLATSSFQLNVRGTDVDTLITGQWQFESGTVTLVSGAHEAVYSVSREALPTNITLFVLNFRKGIKWTVAACPLLSGGGDRNKPEGQ